MSDPLERKISLLMLLRDSPPLLKREIMERTNLYSGDDDDAARAMFERDKRELRRVGVPIEAVITEGDAGATRYTINRKEYDLPDLELAPDEQFALAVAAGAVQLGTSWDSQAVHKLGGGFGPAPLILAEVPTLVQLPALYAAVTGRCVVEFDYKQKSRSVEPHGLFFSNGHWYLDALEGSVRKTFRVDRIESDVKAGEESAFEQDETVRRDMYKRWDPLSSDDEDGVEAHIWIDAVMAPQILRRRPEILEERREDGSIVVSVRASSQYAVRSWVLGLRDHGEILGPPELRSFMVDWLSSIVEAE
ncbi:MAG: helix-turn-helix transcriptional regulator [Acidimicrobiales bacterium]